MEKVERFLHQKLKKEYRQDKSERQTVNGLHCQKARTRTRIRFFFRYLARKKEKKGTLQSQEEHKEPLLEISIKQARNNPEYENLNKLNTTGR
jgi:hypothetical protein